MGKDQLRVTALALGETWSRDGAAAKARDFLVGSGFEIKVLRNTSLVVEFYRQEPMENMRTYRTKVEVPLARVRGASFAGGVLTVATSGPFQTATGTQPWDGALRRRGKVAWTGAAGGSLAAAAASERLLVCAIANTEARVRKDLKKLLDVGWCDADLGAPATAVPAVARGDDAAAAPPKRRFGEEEAFFDAVCPEGARGLLGPLLGLPPAKKKTKKAPGVRDATNAPWF